MKKFYGDALLGSFGKFFLALFKYAERHPETRFWIIIDEVVVFERLIRLPEEQALGLFKWIVAGSAGIGSWVAERHLGKLVFDLPRFTQKQCM